MRSFAELLTDYMARTGISDAELARTLGVRRQTIFRWKEGLVEKPRYREDILRVADRLRLTPEERDGLLLAAGFPPETPAMVLSSTPTFTPTKAPSEPIHTTSRRKLPRKAWLALPILALVIMSIYLFRQLHATPAYPVAAQGETLILIAPLASSAVPSQIPSRKMPTEGETPAPSDLNERLRAALKREIQGARLERVHVALAPDKIAEPTAAETARRRSNARLVIWGNDQSGTLLVMFTPAPPLSRIDDLPLDALVMAPIDMPIRVDVAAPDQIQALALLALSQVYIDEGELDKAPAALMRLPQAQAAWLAQAGYIHQLSRPPDYDQAIQFYTETIELDSNVKTAFLNRGIAYIRQNKPALWQADLNHVLALEPDHAVARAALCWGYALDQQPDAALPQCDAAVRLDPTARSRDVRAIVYAESGRLTDAAKDWQAFLNWLAQQPESLRVRYSSSRSDWLQAVQAGRNPIDAATLERLRQQ